MRTFRAVGLFMQSREARGLSPDTIRWYRGILLSFAQRFAYLPKSPSDIEAFLIGCKAGDERRHGYYRALRVFYNFLSKRWRVRNVMTTVEAPKRTHKEPIFLLPEAIAKLLSYRHAPKIKAALLFLIDTGARLGELFSLRLDDLMDTPWGHVARIRGKTGTRLVPISYETYHALMVNLPLGYSKHRLGRLISMTFRKAGIKGTAHSLRHTFATLWEGEELILQQIMGHAHLSTTKQYRHLRLQTICLAHHQHSPLRMVKSSSQDMFI